MTDASKGRELYVEFCGDPEKDWENYKRYCGAEKFNPISPSDEVIRFIEHSVFTSVQNELKAVREELDSIVHNTNLAGRLEAERIADLEKELAELKAENVRILELARNINLYTIHSRAMNGCKLNHDFSACDCGLTKLRDDLKALATIGEK